MSPAASQIVGKQLDAHTLLVGLSTALTVARHLAVNLLQHTSLLLNMVPNLVSNHIGISKVAIGTKLLFHTHEERQVAIKALVTAAIERTHSSLTLTASSAGSATVKHHFGVVVLA